MKILIFEKRYLIAEGLFSIIKKIENSLDIILINDFIQFKYNIIEKAPDLLFINQDLLPNLSDKTNIAKLQNTKIVLITTNKTISFNQFLIIEKLQITESKDSIATKINNIIEQYIDNLKNENDNNGDISARESEIVKYIAKGNTNKQIAKLLFISPHTVITHRKNITNKLGIKSVSGLTIYAILNNLIEI